MASYSHQNSCREAALRYAQLGWRIFLLAPRSKVTLRGSHGFKDATLDLDALDRAFTEQSNANIAVATGLSRLCVIDVDPRNDGLASFSVLQDQGLVLEDCPIAKSGNNGRHYIFTVDSALPSSSGRLGAGIDVKSAGGYIVLAPSRVGPSQSGPGGPYEWIVSPFDVPPPPLPKWLGQSLLPKSPAVEPYKSGTSPLYAARRLDGLARFVAGARKGERNNVLNWAAFRAGELVKANQVSMPTVVDTLRSAAMASGLDPRSVSLTIQSGLRASIEKGDAPACLRSE